jgi:hypothetical protein
MSSQLNFRLLMPKHVLNSHHQVHFIVPSILPSGDHIIKQSFEDFGLTGYASLWHVSVQYLHSPCYITYGYVNFRHEPRRSYQCHVRTEGIDVIGSFAYFLGPTQSI